MRIARSVAILAGALLPALASAQSSTPVSDTFRRTLARLEKNLVASAEEMPAKKYGYKPTAAQMTFGEVVLHVAGDNYEACAPIGDVRAPDVPKLAPTDDKDKLVQRLRDSFALCDLVAGHLDDSSLGGVVSSFGIQWPRAGLMAERIEDWADHYSQMAIYLRLNGLLPPTAQPRS
jgi:hypothetical protein